ncbi:hypothetical protein F52700_3448 [Fusarium sp. NRRL 52700]|nr:hypothetical protein F52700_3448 [Fusarium sp. NRRL 52700]
MYNDIFQSAANPPDNPQAPLRAPPFRDPPQAPALQTPAPQPAQGILDIEAINLTAHIIERPPRSTLYTEGSLTRNEHTFFIELAQMTHQVKEGRNIPCTLDHWRDFWNMVFRGWDTSVGNADGLPLRAVTPADNRVRASKLKATHPSGSNIRP